MSMFTIYIFIAYVITFAFITALFVYFKLVKPKFCKSNWIRLTVIIILLFLPLLPYVIVASQTFLFGMSVLSATRQAMTSAVSNNHIPINNLKVLIVTPRYAKVYAETTVDSGYPFGVSRMGYTFKLRRLRDDWTFVENSDECIWTEAGSASGNIFPPYPSIGE